MVPDSHHRHLLQVDQLADAFAREREQRQELLLAERVFSAVAWISTMLPAPVMTKLASVSASESSA